MSARKSTPATERSGGSKRTRRGSASKGASRSGSRAVAPTRRGDNARSGTKGRAQSAPSAPLPLIAPVPGMPVPPIRGGDRPKRRG